MQSINQFQLRAFHAVASRLSFTQAARLLGLTQPSVSQAVKTLEARHNVRLLDRTSRRVRLTEVGERLFRLTTRLVDLEEEVTDLLGGEGDLAGGRLSVAADSPYGVMPIIAELRQRHPGLEVALEIGNAELVLAILHAARADVVLLSDPPAGAHLERLRLWPEPIWLMLPAGHPLAARARVPVAELAGEGLVLREPGSMTRRTVDGALAALGLVPVRRFEVTGREAVQEAVAHGLGLGFVSVLEARPDPRVVLRPLDGVDLSTEEYLVCLKDRRHTPAIRAFREAASSVASNGKEAARHSLE
jgi:aminoethylphosphonate catabolism LysR family transcriptional regulator